MFEKVGGSASARAKRAGWADNRECTTHKQEQVGKAEERAARAEAQAREAGAAVEERVAGKERELGVQEAHFAAELVR